MGKSKRSKIKMAYKAMRRAVMEPKHDEKLREQAGKVYAAIGLPMPEERAEEAQFRPRSHGGSELVSTFVPTPKGPKLNCVHGPLADDLSRKIPQAVVGFPIAGAAARARRSVGRGMDVDEEAAAEEKRYFFHRKSYDSSYIKKPRKNPRRQQRMNKEKILKQKQKKAVASA